MAVAGIDDPNAAALLAAAPAPKRVGVTTGVPRPGEFGVVDGVLVDRAFGSTGSGGAELLDARSVHPPGPPGITDALAAAALARADGVAPEAVRTALEGFRPGRHRAEPVATVRAVTYVDDSKATNPHAAAASLAAVRPGARVVWIVGGLLKGASVDELVARHAGRLRGVVVIGTDRTEILGALARHAPEVPVTEVITGDDGPVPAAVTMTLAVQGAAALARPGDVVLLAPAAASMDQFRDYAARGDAFATAVARLDPTAVAGLDPTAVARLDPTAVAGSDRA